jgi:UDPglucose 6-dehydrogenase
MKITVIGTGYVGLVSGTCFSHFGFEVVCVDQNAGKIKSLSSGHVPIYEPGLEAIIMASTQKGRLSFTTNLQDAMVNTAVIFIAVGTPTDDLTGRADLSYVYEAGRQIAKLLTSYTVVVIKSTVPVGTAKKLRSVMLEANPSAKFDVASNPEFLREGSAVEDFLKPDRVVIGLNSTAAETVMRAIYQPLSNQNVPMIFTTSESAELTKYAANCYLAMRIAFVNQMSDLCEAVGADIAEVALGAGLDERIGTHYFAPGPGYGGSCFPKDTKALVAIGRDSGSPVSIIEDVVLANDKRRVAVANKIANALGGNLKGKRIAILGIAFKAETDDLRDAAALTVIPTLQNMGADIVVFDPVAMEHGAKIFSDVTWAADLYKAANQSDAVVVLTEWSDFRGVDFPRLMGLVKTPIIIDFRNLYEPSAVTEFGFSYYSMGRQPKHPV